MTSISQASLSAAILAGRRLVDTPFFSFLDDDDEYLPGATSIRLDALARNPDAAFAVANGFRSLDGHDTLALEWSGDIAIDPLKSLLKRNWLASCGGLFRTAAVEPELFEDVPRYLEWTWIAYRIVTAGKVPLFVDEPVFRVHDTPGSESKSEAYLLAHPGILQRMRARASRADIRHLLSRKLASAWHSVCTHYVEQRMGRAAWLAHIRSCMVGDGYRYLTFTRKLPPFRRLGG